MTVKYLDNALSHDIVNELIDIYNNADEYDTDTMKKLSGEDAMNVLKNVDAIDTDRINVIHYYKHKLPYYPHSDYHFIEKENIVLPLQVINGENPYLVIFDQYYYEDACTWTGDMEIKFKINTGVQGRPYDFDIDNKTHKPIPKYLYRYLDWQPQDFWYGLSGEPYEFKPGSMMQFDSKRLHATSTLRCEEKLGLTIRYKI